MLSLSSLFALYTLTPGRRIYALSRVQEHPKAQQWPKLLEALAAAIELDRKVLVMDAFRRLKKTSKLPPVRIHDRAVDRQLVMLDRLLLHHSRDNSKGPTATQLRGTVFPAGVNRHIRLAFVEQAAANDRVLEVFEGDTYKQWINARGLREMVEDLRAAHDLFGAALRARDDASAPTWDQVKAARELSQNAYLEIVAMIIMSTIGDASTRSSLLAPIQHQDEEIKAYRRQRRKLVDIDPDTGDLLEDQDPDEGLGEEVGEDLGDQLDEVGDDGLDDELDDEADADADE